jgi:diadenosine tetraphosphatase ApaH/serine/threonine PP2A family protein phosphatase
VDRLLCLGDLVGYGADPVRIVDAVSRRDAIVVAGNHDHASAGRMDLEWFNPYARAAAEWTAGRLSADQHRYLGELPLVLEYAGATLVHSSPRDPESWPYLVSAADGAAAFGAFATKLCFVGHSHMPAVWTLHADGTLDYTRGAGRTVLTPGNRYVVNVGSVGQPRDGDPTASYAVWDLDEAAVDILRVPYDIMEARRRIHAAGLPKVLGDRLLHGR